MWGVSGFGFAVGFGFGAGVCRGWADAVARGLALAVFVGLGAGAGDFLSLLVSRSAKAGAEAVGVGVVWVMTTAAGEGDSTGARGELLHPASDRADAAIVAAMNFFMISEILPVARNGPSVLRRVASGLAGLGATARMRATSW